MKVARNLVVAIVGTLLVLAIIGLLLPRQVHVERSIAIDATPQQIYGHVGNLRQWKEWTAWNAANYPNMKWSYAGPEAGVGAESKWQDPSAGGNGHLIVTKADPQTGIEYDLKFEDEAPVPGWIKFAPEGKNTKVTWAFDADMGWSPVGRYIGFFFLDGWVGKDFEAGLATLKRKVESESLSSGDPEVTKPEAAIPTENPPTAGGQPAPAGESNE